MWNLPSRRDNKCKGHEAGTDWAYLKNKKEANIAGAE